MISDGAEILLALCIKPNYVIPLISSYTKLLGMKPDIYIISLCIQFLCHASSIKNSSTMVLLAC